MARGEKQAGQALVFSAFLLTALLGFMGLGIDVAQLRVVQREAQLAADSAAIAGSAELLYGDVTTGAQGDAALNGFTNGTGGATVTVNNPPLTGPHTGNAKYVEVIVAQSQPTFFAKIFGITSEPVSARAVATQTSGPACIYALDPSASNSYNASGGAVIKAQCGLVVDSNNADAYVDSGGACSDFTSIGIVGGIQQNMCSTPASPTTGIIPDPNPLAYLNSETPSVGACNYTNFNKSGSNSSTTSQGVYCGGITVSGGYTLTLNPGTYILNGGGLNISGGSTLSGNGVMFYNTSSSGHSFGSIQLSGGNNTTLYAPTTGEYAGILIFQDPTASSSVTNAVSGGTTSIIQGALYFPTQTLNYSGGSSTSAAYTIVVADKINISGSANFGDNYTSLPGGVSPIANAVLVE